MASTTLPKPNLELSEDQERIMEVSFLRGRTLLSLGALTYYEEKTQRWYFPLLELSDLLGFYMAISNDAGKAGGYIIEKDNTFEIDVNTCQVHLKGELKKYRCDETVNINEDIYISQERFSEWFPLKFTVEPFRSRVWIDPTDDNVPAFSRWLRKIKIRPGQRGESFDPGYERINQDYSWANGLFWDQNLEYEYIKSKDFPLKKTFSQQMHLSGEFLKFNANYILNTEENRTNFKRLNFKREEYTPISLGPIELTKIELWDVYPTSDPLIGSSFPVRGFKLSNRPINIPSNYGKETIEGDLGKGWEVELYQNEIYIGTQDPNEQGRYQFKDVILNYGTNIFRLDFFGPNGEERVVYKNYIINSTILSKEDFFYSASHGQDHYGKNNYRFSFEKGLIDGLSSKLVYSNMYLNTDGNSHDYGYLEFNGFTNYFYFNTNFAKDLKFEGDIYSYAITLPLSFIQLQFNHLFRNDIVTSTYSPLNKIKEERKLQFTMPIFNRFVLRNTYIREISTDNFIIDKFNPVLLFQYNKFRFQDPITITRYVNRPNPTFINHAPRIDIVWPSLKFRFQGFLQQRPEFRFNTLQAQVEHLASETFKYKLIYQKQFSSNDQKYQLAYSKIFPGFGLTHQISTDNQNNYETSLSIDFSLSRDSEDNTFHFKNYGQAQSGAVHINVFYDIDQDGIQDPNEVGLKDITVKHLQRREKHVSDKNGHVFIQALPSQKPADFRIVSTTLPEINQYSALDGLRVYPRSGKTTTVNLPVVLYGEAEGTVFVRVPETGELRSFPGVILEVHDQKTGEIVQMVRTDLDGLYMIEKIAPGKYYVSVSSDYSERRKRYPNIDKIYFEIDAQHDLVTDLNFIVSKDRPAGLTQPHSPAIEIKPLQKKPTEIQEPIKPIPTIYKEAPSDPQIPQPKPQQPKKRRVPKTRPKTKERDGQKLEKPDMSPEELEEFYRQQYQNSFAMNTSYTSKWDVEVSHQWTNFRPTLFFDNRKRDILRRWSRKN